MVVLLSTIPLFFIFYIALDAYPGKLMISLLMTLLMLVFGFNFASVTGTEYRTLTDASRQTSNNSKVGSSLKHP